MLIRLGLLVLLGAIVLGVPAALAASVKEPAYTVISREDDLELREYAPLIRAETVVQGPYKESLNDGFRILADYIFGGNAGSRKIAMTAPVGAEATDAGWRVSFVMPAEYTLDTLPRPLDPRVTLREVPAHRVAALRFRGWAGEADVEERKAELARAMARQGLEAAGEPVVAQYNPPWTVPFLRRNEILVEIR